MGYREFAEQSRVEVERFRLPPDRIADLSFPVLRWVLAERVVRRVGNAGYLDCPLVGRFGLWAEFGVFRCESLAILAGNRGTESPPDVVETAARVVGFDSFRGLPEPWYDDPTKGERGEYHPAGEFALPGVPEAPDGAELVVGLFRDTLPGFRDRGADLTLLHVDCDIYSSAREALEWAHPRLCPGSVVVFDELVDYVAYAEHEMRALYEARERGLRWEWLAFGRQDVAILVTDTGTR